MLRQIGIGLPAVAACVAIESKAFGAIGATATITSETALPSGQYEYAVTLNNTGTTPITTFWFGWVLYAGSIPYDLMPSQASSVVSPTGSNGASLHDGVGSYGIEWDATGGALAAAQSKSGFVFDSPDTPATINGTSFFLGYPVRESWVYQNQYTTPTAPNPNAPFTPDIAPAPEPMIGLIAAPALLAMRRRRR